MVRYRVLLGLVGLLVAVPRSADAATLNIPASAFGIDNDLCTKMYGGDYVVASSSSSGTCWGQVPILLPAGTTVSSITLYYYDNSSSCSVWAAFTKTSSSVSGSVIGSSFTSSSSSSSMQSTTFSTSTTLSSSYWYNLEFYSGYASGGGCRVYSVKVSY